MEQEKETFDLVVQANGFEIHTPEQYESAAGFLKEIKQFQATIKADQRKVVDAAYKSWKTALSTMQAHLAKPERAEAIIKSKIAAYDAEQRRIEREAREKAMREAEEQARKERAAAAKAALEAAEQAAEEHDDATAEMAFDEAVTIESTPIIPVLQNEPLKPHKIKGTSTRIVYDAVVTHFAQLPDEYKIADEKKLRKVVNAHKGECVIPGVRITQRTIVSQRTK